MRERSDKVLFHIQARHHVVARTLQPRRYATAAAKQVNGAFSLIQIHVTNRMHYSRYVKAFVADAFQTVAHTGSATEADIRAVTPAMTFQLLLALPIAPTLPRLAQLNRRHLVALG